MQNLWQSILVILIITLMHLPLLVVLIDIYNSKFKTNNKWIWFAVVLVFNYFGAILYLLIGKQQKLNT